MQVDPARIESLLDNGWRLISQLHWWLTKWPQKSADQVALFESIRGLQLLWAEADDLGLKRLARTSLAIEQFLERYCARTLEFTSERLIDITAGIGGLQELLLGLEATREEPAIADLEALKKLEHCALHSVWFDHAPTAVKISALAGDDTSSIIVLTEPISNPSVALSQVMPIRRLEHVQHRIERPLLEVLEQFVVRVDETCRRLHARMLADEAPYVTTTSRLEHLAHVTRELVDQIGHQSLGTEPARIGESSEQPNRSLNLEAVPLLSVTAPALDDVLPSMMPSERSRMPSGELRSSRESSIIEYSLSACESKLVDHEVETSRILIVEESLDSSAEFASSHRIEARRVLIVEESLFFRHLIELAIRSAGYECQALDSVASGLEALDQSPRFCAILGGSTAVSEMAHAIERYRRTESVKVICLTMPDQLQQSAAEVDAHVPKSNPRQLIAVLDRLLNASSNAARKIA